MIIYQDKYITVVKLSLEGKNKLPKYNVYNAAITALLGQIKFYGAWRKFVFAPKDDTIFDVNCLEKISFLLDSLTNEWRKNKNVEINSDDQN